MRRLIFTIGLTLTLTGFSLPVFATSSLSCPIPFFSKLPAGCSYRCSQTWSGYGCPVCTISCPKPTTQTCTRADCGPAMGMPNWRCANGDVGGPVCERRANGTCGYVIHNCPRSNVSSAPTISPAPVSSSNVCPSGQIHCLPNALILCRCANNTMHEVACPSNQCASCQGC